MRYHGGCAGCLREGTTICNSCMYKGPNWSLPDLGIRVDDFSKDDRNSENHVYDILDKLNIKHIESYLRLKKLNKLK